MSILKYKYKAHKFINYAFYIVVFIFGFLLGFSTQKIDFNKLISQVLMIDNVSAYTIVDDVDEYKIVDMLSTKTDYDSTIYKNYICFKSSNLYCYAFDDETLENLYFNYSTSNYIKFTTHGLTFQLEYNINNKSYTVDSSPTGVTADYSYSTFKNSTYLNFIPKGYESDSWLNSRNLLDFEGINLKFNENLFKDNPDFKEVCVDKGKKYSITTTNIDIVSNSIFVSDFIWFPGKVTGVKYSEYDSLEEDNILVFNDDVSTENYYFKDKEKIDLLYNDEIISNYFIHSGYTDKYSLYGYTAYKFIHSYYIDDDNNSQNMFTIFDFTDMNFSPFGSAGGSSSSFGDTPLTYCFYIKNEFNVTELKTDEWNDYVGVVPTPGGDLEVQTSHNKNNYSDNIDSSFNTVNDFISRIKPTINFIKDNVYSFYLSLPLLVRMFLISIFVILIVKFIIGMVVR